MANPEQKSSIRRFADAVVQLGGDVAAAQELCKTLGPALASGYPEDSEECIKHVKKCLASMSSGKDGRGAEVVGSFLVEVAACLEGSNVRRMHMLYFMDDLVTFSHAELRTSTDTFVRFLPLVLTLTAAGDLKQTPWIQPAISDLLAKWRQDRILSKALVSELIDRMLEAEITYATTGWKDLVQTVRKEEALIRQQLEQDRKDAQWSLPSTHCLRRDPYTVWYDLPAANGLYLKRTKGYPLKTYALPQGGLPIKEGAPSAKMKSEAKALHTEALRAFEKQTNADEVKDVDKLGNIIWKDTDRPTRNYYGWDIDLIERRKELARQFAEAAAGYPVAPQQPPQYGRYDMPPDQRYGAVYNNRRGFNDDFSRGNNYNGRGGRGNFGNRGGGRGGGYGRGGMQRPPGQPPGPPLPPLPLPPQSLPPQSLPSEGPPSGAHASNNMMNQRGANSVSSGVHDGRGN